MPVNSVATPVRVARIDSNTPALGEAARGLASTGPSGDPVVSRGSVRIGRRVAGWLWVSAWLAVLYAFAAPWRHLGGLVEERLRWLEHAVLAFAPILGCLVGSFVRDASQRGIGWTHIRSLRVVLWPLAAAIAVLLIVLRLTGNRDAIGVAASALLAYWAGMDLAVGAWPLTHGLHYRLGGPIERDPEPATQEEGDEL